VPPTNFDTKQENAHLAALVSGRAFMSASPYPAACTFEVELPAGRQQRCETIALSYRRILVTA
jgi:hypothetical protein